MGNTNSKRRAARRKGRRTKPTMERRTRIQYLGDRYPFGDEEILRLYRCQTYLRSARHSRRSFLSDWAVYASTLPPSPNDDVMDYEVQSEDSIVRKYNSVDVRAERACAMGIVEGRILPSGFGRRLERSLFLLSPDVVDYKTESMMSSQFTPPSAAYYSSDDDSSGKGDCGCIFHPCRNASVSAHPPRRHDLLLAVMRQEETEQMSFQRLEKFMEGAAECGRRGALPALTALFKCCSRNSRGGYTSDMNFGRGGSHSWVEFSSANSGGNCDPRSKIMANALEVLDLGYSLALAGAFLQAVDDAHMTPNHSEDGSSVSENGSLSEKKSGSGGGFGSALAITRIDPDDYIPDEESTALEALSNSLLEHSANRLRCKLANPYSSPFGIPPSPVTSSSSSTSSSNKHKRGWNMFGGEDSTNEGMVTLDIFLEWAECHAPLLSAALSTFMHHVLFPDRPYPQSRTPFVYPNLRGWESALFEGPSSPLLFMFACMSPDLGGTWHRIYTSDSDGLSFNRLQLSLLGYGGPTLLIIKETGGGVFGAFTRSQWKESKDFYGTSDCFLYQLLPSTNVCKPSGTGTNFMYCNSEARSKGYDGQAHGIGFGGNIDEPRIFIPETLESCCASSQDMTFERGALLPPERGGGLRKYFDVETLEVWGVGGDEVVMEALGARHREREIVAAKIRKARKVDKAQFLEDFNSGILDSKAFKHKDHVRGRADCHIHENPKRGYVFEK